MWTCRERCIRKIGQSRVSKAGVRAGAGGCPGVSLATSPPPHGPAQMKGKPHGSLLVNSKALRTLLKELPAWPGASSPRGRLTDVFPRPGGETLNQGLCVTKVGGIPVVRMSAQSHLTTHMVTPVYLRITPGHLQCHTCLPAQSHPSTCTITSDTCLQVCLPDKSRSSLVTGTLCMTSVWHRPSAERVIKESS